MNERVSALDASLLYLDHPTTPMHVGSVAIFRTPDEGFDHDRLVEIIAQRIALVPRYRQRIRQVPSESLARFGSMTPTLISRTTFAARRSRGPDRGNNSMNLSDVSWDVPWTRSGRCGRCT